MTFQVLDAGTLRTISAGQVKVAGVMRPLRFIKAMDGGSLRTVATFIQPLTVSANDAGGNGDGTEGTTVSTTIASTATPSGGLGPFTYAWTLIANGGGDASYANTPSAASTTFNKGNVPASQIYADTWRVTVTDSLGSTATADITVTFRNISSGGTL